MDSRNISDASYWRKIVDYEDDILRHKGEVFQAIPCTHLAPREVSWVEACPKMVLCEGAEFCLACTGAAGQMDAKICLAEHGLPNGQPHWDRRCIRRYVQQPPASPDGGYQCWTARRLWQLYGFKTWGERYFHIGERAIDTEHAATMKEIPCTITVLSPARVGKDAPVDNEIRQALNGRTRRVL